MPDEVSVRQVSGLPRASFRFRLTTDTLASGYELGATSCSRDFHPLKFAHAGHTKKAPPGACLRGFSVPSFSLFPGAYTRKNLAETPKKAASFVANSGVMGLTPCSMSETRT